MDFLSHLFLPLTAIYLVRHELFDSPWLLGTAGFGLLPDFDKFLGSPGLLHSLVTLVPVGLAIIGIESWLRDEPRISPVILAFLGSHLLLDLLDGGPVPLLFPLAETGIGLQYPAQTVFAGPIGLHFDGPLVALRTAAPRPSNNTYGFITGGGVANMLLFGVVYTVDRRRWRRDTTPETSNPASERPDAAEAATDDNSRRRDL